METMMNTLVERAVIAFLALCAIQNPVNDSDIAALHREIQSLESNQAEIQRDLRTIKSLLEALARPQQREQDPLIDKFVQLKNEPRRGTAAAKVTIIEVSDYHCPFCRRHSIETLPKIIADYVETGQVRYVFMDFPIDNLHPDSFRSHEAAGCAGEQGKYWEMHDLLFMSAPARDVSQLIITAGKTNIDIRRFTNCLNAGAGGTEAAAIRERIAQMQRIGISGTPMLLMGHTPADDSPMRISTSVHGAQPYAVVKAAIDSLLDTK